METASLKSQWTCDICNVTVQKTGKSRHLKTKTHEQKMTQTNTIPKNPGNKPLPPPPSLNRWEVRERIANTLYHLLKPVEHNGISESVYDYLLGWWFEQPQIPSMYHFCSNVIRMLHSRLFDDNYFFGEMTMLDYLRGREITVNDFKVFFERKPQPSAPILRNLSEQNKQTLDQLIDQVFGSIACAGIDSNVYEYIYNWWEKIPEPPTIKQVEEILIKIRSGKLWGDEDFTLETYLIGDKLCATEIEWGFPKLPEP